LSNPRLFMRNSTIQVAFTNFDAAAAYNGYSYTDNRNTRGSSSSV